LLGGTVDITVHRVEDKDHVKEIYKANGGSWGGTIVDEKFSDMLSGIVGKTCFELFKKENSYDYLELMRRFELKKRLTKADGSYKLTIDIPISLNDLCKVQNEGKAIGDLLQTPEFKNKGLMFRNKLRLSAECGLDLFTDPVKQITDHIQSLFEEQQEVREVTTLLMVGGFSESDVLQTRIRKTFPQCKLIAPQEPGLAVLKGAVIFGHDPLYITTRICRFTYGVEVYEVFTNGVHDPARKFIDEISGEERCNGVFDVYATVGQSVDITKPLKSKEYFPIKVNQQKMRLQVYLSNEKKPMYTDDESCTKLGDITVDISGLSSENQDVDVTMTFSRTEFEVKAIVKTTGKIVKANFDFLH